MPTSHEEPRLLLAGVEGVGPPCRRLRQFTKIRVLLQDRHHPLAHEVGDLAALLRPE
ncbi:MAG: hypothetical protein ABR606_02660 [Vicinamibacterales bacterium]